MISFVLPVLVTAVGAYLIVKLRGFFILHPIRTLKVFLSALKEKTARRSLCLALAGTLGVGNIFGVAAGIMIGGAGSVLWLLISAVFAMVIKYAETLLSFDCLTADGGGMHHVLCLTFKRSRRGLGLVYALLCTLLALLMGAGIQSAAVADVASASLELSPAICAAAFPFLVAFGIIGGSDKIEKTTEIIIPLITIIYILLSFLVIFLNISRLDDAFYLIISSALSPMAAGGGILAFFTSRALTEGFARGILSNEAGAGTSALAHIRSSERAPKVAGLFGMCEVFFDTVLLCMLTAISILVSVDDTSAFGSPMGLVTVAFTSALGSWVGYLLPLLILAFAYSTVICWYYYGSECSSYLLGRRAKKIFPPLFFLFVAIGALLGGELLLPITDLILLSMSVLTLAAIMKKSDRIAELTK